MNGTPTFDVSYLVAPAIILFIVISLAATGRLSRLSRSRTRIFIFSLGALLSVLSVAIVTPNFLIAFRWFDPVATGVTWLLLYEICRPLLHRFAQRPIVSFLVSTLLVSMLKVPLEMIPYFVYYAITQPALIDSDRLPDVIFGALFPKQFANDLLNSSSALIVIPDDCLFLIPFEMLSRSASASAQSLCSSRSSSVLAPHAFAKLCTTR